MDNQHDLFDQDDEPIIAAQPDAYTTRLLAGSLAPIMHPESLRRIEANYQAWLRERRAGEAAQ